VERKLTLTAPGLLSLYGSGVRTSCPEPQPKIRSADEPTESAALPELWSEALCPNAIAEILSGLCGAPDAPAPYPGSSRTGDRKPPMLSALGLALSAGRCSCTTDTGSVRRETSQ
jgi:hypothetical protein